ncbi:hypothetical protein PsorP6_009717 [Peronosclerospora sorghi]|uniref:Uncharacterized protein n=1 Tax=Peronosclerospora sorghi TaxID=230839 RepID=A0ACC0W131_9STRA|nr:hypothetical protein PsorP6_009717 [Peronosclerospora sorghi]
MESSPLLALHARTEATAFRPHDTRRPSARARSHWFSRLPFTWLHPLLHRRTSPPLEGAELGPEHDTIDVKNRLCASLDPPLSLSKCLYHTLGTSLYRTAAWKLAGVCFRVLVPLCVHALIHYVHDPTFLVVVSSDYDAYLLTASFLVASMAQTLCVHQHDQSMLRHARTVRSASTMVVYENSLTLSLHRTRAITSRTILDTTLRDSNRIHDLVSTLHSLWAAPLQFLLGLLLLVHYLGAAASFVGVGTLLTLVLPLRAFLSSQGATSSNTRRTCTTTRQTLVTHVVEHIRAIKLDAWESAVVRRVEASRARELDCLQRVHRWQAYETMLGHATPVLVAVATFATLSYLEPTALTPDKAFPALLLVPVVQKPLQALPDVVALLAPARAALERLQSILHLDHASQPPRPQSTSWIRSHAAYELRHATFGYMDPPDEWSAASSSTPPPLANVTLSIPRGKLTLIVGAHGSGKSTLVAALCREMPPTSGIVHVPTTNVSLAAQPPFILPHTTLHDNIVAGAPVDTVRLHRVLKCCNLERELLMLPQGLQTVTDAQGAPLSTSQQDRVALARALYPRDQALYVVDASFDALAPSVATRVFRDCVSSDQGLVAGCTRVVTTRSFALAPMADWILVLDKRRVVDMGTFHDLLQRRPTGPVAAMHALDPRGADAGHEESAEATLDTETEERASWHASVASCGGVSTMGVVALLLARQLASVATDLWLVHWTRSALYGADGTTVFVTTYAVLSLTPLVLGLVGDLVGRTAGRSAARSMHHALLHCVAKGTMRFFETTRVARVLACFCHDIERIDDELAPALVHFLSSFLDLMSLLIVQTSVAPTLLVVVLPLSFFALYAARSYAHAHRALERRATTATTALAAYFTHTLDGLGTLKTFHLLAHCVREQARRVDDDTNARRRVHGLDQWLHVRLELLGTTSASALAVLLTRERGADDVHRSSALVGLLLCYSVHLSSHLRTLVRSYMDVTAVLPSVARIERACAQVDTEPLTLVAHVYDEWTAPPSRVLALRPHWPEHGHLEFVHVRFPSAPSAPPVSFTVHQSDTIAVGGADARTLVDALFRLTPLAHGAIFIDHVDTTALALTELRARLALIPRDAVVFAASVRWNLDPRGVATDAELWRVLGTVRLETMVRSVRGGLDARVGDGGGIHWRRDVRRRVALARALLKRAKVVVVEDDEADAASVEDTTGAWIFQETMRTALADATVLTVTDRVETIRQADKVLVLAHGQMVAFRPPSELQRTEWTTLLGQSIEADAADVESE